MTGLRHSETRYSDITFQGSIYRNRAHFYTPYVVKHDMTTCYKEPAKWSMLFYFQWRLWTLLAKPRKTLPEDLVDWRVFPFLAETRVEKTIYIYYLGIVIVILNHLNHVRHKNLILFAVVPRWTQCNITSNHTIKSYHYCTKNWQKMEARRQTQTDRDKNE